MEFKDKEAFYRTHTEEEQVDRKKKEKRDVFSISVNREEREMLDELKKLLDISSDGQALKMGSFIGLHVLHGMFGRKFLAYLFKKDRKKLSDLKAFSKLM